MSYLTLAQLAPLLIPLGKGILLGIGAAVPPGPVNLEIARRGVRGGFLAGASVGFGAVTVDVILATLLVLGVLQLIQQAEIARLIISAVGVLLLAYLGFMSLRNVRRHLQRSSHGRSDSSAMPLAVEPTSEPTVANVAAETPRAGYVTGLLLCSTSPYQAAFWLVGVPMVLGQSAQVAAGRDAVLLCVGVFAATLTWVCFFSSLTAWISSTAGRWRTILVPTMDLVGGIVLLGFALFGGWDLARTFFLRT